ncbi:unnamed protein product [Mytilus coruscus]|uniref:SGNH hydrolase-type esterase domain-containing protein n=1 Tax=Mytilus coruscus TaxID=42192 RepID=A0A6J8AN77_MYTCO|nr:unnamed protein product [Mytilus coruscus]
MNILQIPRKFRKGDDHDMEKYGGKCLPTFSKPELINIAKSKGVKLEEICCWVESRIPEKTVVNLCLLHYSVVTQFSWIRMKRKLDHLLVRGHVRKGKKQTRQHGCTFIGGRFVKQLQFYLVVLNIDIVKRVKRDIRPGPKVLILGHSFISRLTQALTYDPKLSQDFNLAQGSVSCFGRRGGKLDRVNSEDLNANITYFQRSVIILQIGGNDFCDPGLKPETLACKLVDLVS